MNIKHFLAPNRTLNIFLHLAVQHKILNLRLILLDPRLHGWIFSQHFLRLSYFFLQTFLSFLYYPIFLNPKIMQMFPDSTRCFQIQQDVSRFNPMFPDSTRCFQIQPDVFRFNRMFPDSTRCFQIQPDVSRFNQMFPD